MKKRSQIEEKYKWDLSRFCKNDEDFYARLKKLEEITTEIKKYEGKLASSDDVLFECLELDDKFEQEIDFLYLYACLTIKGDFEDKKANEMYEKISSFVTKYSNMSNFVGVEVAKLSEKHLKELQNVKKFKNYKRLFEATLRQKKHILSKKEEFIFSSIGEFIGGFSDNFDKFTDVDLKFSDIKDSKDKTYHLNSSNYSLYVESKDRELRKNAFKEMNGQYGKFINFLSTNFINNVKKTATIYKLKKYPSVLSGKIYNEEASEKTYNLLIKKVRENISIIERLFEIKRKMLGQNDIAIYDTFAPVCSELHKKFTYDEAIEIIKKAVSVLGDDYVALIDRAKNERWIDVYPNENKESGAFSWGCYGATPVVHTNFEGNLSSVFTLAHELGHAMHTYFSNENQPYQTAGYTIFVAEVASTTNEMLLLYYLLNNAKSDKEKIYYYNYFLTNVRSTIFRQTMFSEFEQFVFEKYENGEPLTKHLLCDKYQELNKYYYGKKVKQIPEMQYEWARIPHFFTPFYVYKYATGLICAINIANNLVEHKNDMQKRYRRFLSSGSIKSPILLLKECGCDLEDEKIYNDVFAFCKKIIANWEGLIK